MLPTVIIIVVTVVILAIIFLPRHKEKLSDYKEKEYHPSGHEWVFNGLLYIDNPPERPSVFKEYEGDIQLITKKGFVQLDICLADDVKESDIGLYYVDACIHDNSAITIEKDGRCLATVVSPQPKLCASIAEKGGVAQAYCFIAWQPERKEYYGSVCICK